MRQQEEETEVLVTPQIQTTIEEEPEGLLKNSRQNFVRKVYGIVCYQLLMMSAFVIAAASILPLRTFLRTNMVLFILSLVVTLSTMYALACYKMVARSVPINYILLFFFTLSESYSV